MVDPGQILLGTDFPFMPETTTVETIDGLEQFDGFDDEDLGAVGRQNALKLFARLNGRAG